MTTTTDELNRLMDNLRIRLPGAVDGALKLELFNTLDDFLKRTNIWKETFDFDTEDGERSYTLYITTPCLVVRLLSLKNSDGTPYAAGMYEPPIVVLASDPTPGVTLTATVALSVLDPVDRLGYPHLPDWIIQKYRELIMNGVMSKMMSQSSKPYSSERMAVYHARAFNSAIADARADDSRQNTFNSNQFTFPRAFMPSGRRRG